MKKILFVITLLLIVSCGKEPEIIDKKLLGRFSGTIGRHLFDQENLVNRTAIRFDGEKDVKLNITLDLSSVHQNIIIYDEMNIFLKNVSQRKSYFIDRDLEQGSINLFTKEKGKTYDDEKNYIWMPEKERFSIKLEEVNLDKKNIEVPFLRGYIKGYLFNVADNRDSIFIDAKFNTEAL